MAAQCTCIYNSTGVNTLNRKYSGLDFAPPDQSKIRPDAPIVVVQHGLTGGEPHMCPIHLQT